MRALRRRARPRRATPRSARTSAPSARPVPRRWSTSARTAAASSSGARAARTEPCRARGTCTSICRSARRAAATATSSRSSATARSTAATSRRSSRELALERAAARPAARVDLPRRRHADADRGVRRSSACSLAARRATVTVEANPETVDAPLASLLRALRRRPRLARRADLRRRGSCATLDRAAQPDDVRRAFQRLREAGFDNISLDLIYGIPGQAPSDLERDLDEALALEPEHVSAYELEAKPGTRFTHAHGAELARQAESMESYFELVVDTADRRRLPLVRDRELLPRARARRRARPAGRAQPRLSGSATTTSGSGSAPSARSRAGAGGTRRRCRATSRRSSAVSGRRARSRSCRRRFATPSGSCSGCGSTSRCRSTGLGQAVDAVELERLVEQGLVRSERGALSLTPRGRFLGGGVTARLLA